MKKNDYGNFQMPPLNQQHNAFEEASRLFGHMTSEVKRQSEIDREADRNRSPLVKAFFALALLSCLLAVGVGAYGIYSFPDAPIKENGSEYSGKYGKPYKKDDFEKFVLWKQSLFVSFAAVFTLGFTGAALDARERRKRESSEKRMNETFNTL